MLMDIFHNGTSLLLRLSQLLQLFLTWLLGILQIFSELVKFVTVFGSSFMVINNMGLQWQP